MIAKGQVVFVHVGSQQIIPGLIGSNTLMKILQAGKIFQIVELIFDSTMNGLHVAVVAPGLDGNAFVNGSQASHGLFEAVAGAVLAGAADELRAVVGLELQGFKVDPAGFQVTGDDPGEQAGVGRGFFLGKA